MATCFTEVKNQFKLENWLPEQIEGIKAFFETDSHVFVSLPTGFGKSLFYQSLPLVAECLYERPRCTSTLVVISPLKALMKDQLKQLQEEAYFPAVTIVDEAPDDAEILQHVINGGYTHVFGSPECLLASPAWRDIFLSPLFCETLTGVAIDEAHCVVQW